MSTLAHPRPLVQPEFPRLAELVPDLADLIQREPEPFRPSLKEEAWDLAYSIARQGGRPVLPRAWEHLDGVGLSFALGKLAGNRAREVADARELGRPLGEMGSPICEPPAGFSDAEKAAYREGYAAGLAEFEDDLATEAWAAEHEPTTPDAYMPGYVTDFDLYPMGCMS